jgi:hypothetical protein
MLPQPGSRLLHWHRSTEGILHGKDASRINRKTVTVVIKRRPASNTISAKALPPRSAYSGALTGGLALLIGATLVVLLVQFHAGYTVSPQSPLRIAFQWPLVIARRSKTQESFKAQSDQRHPLSAYQQYACVKFGPECRVALAIQRAENPQGKCEIYHYNADGTLDWGYFQINTVHLKRPGLNLRDLLDCKANIDFAYQLYLEKHGFTSWSTFNNGRYRRYLRD